MYRLVNPIQSYPWGSRSAIAELLGEPAPTAEPQAELWMGAHPSAPSRVVRGGVPQSLVEAVEEAPYAMLGAAAVETFGTRLPFLLKVLAVDRPLSLQAHPDRDRARAGYAAEQAAGIPLNSPRRTYRDDNHKPELICALTPFDALCGLRPVEEMLAILGELAVPVLEPAGEALARDGGPEGVRRLLGEILRTPEPAGLVDSVRDACRRWAHLDGPFAASYRCAEDLAARFPGDPGVAVSLLLNRVHLRPGQATYLPPGRLHAYLHGVGIEVMASSDNVLRGGLTTKQVAVEELLAATELRCSRPETLDGRPDGEGWSQYPTPAADFALARARLDAGSVMSDVQGPQILLCVDGELSLCDVDVDVGGGGAVPFGRGQSVFGAAGERLSVRGTGTVFRGTPGTIP